MVGRRRTQTLFEQRPVKTRRWLRPGLLLVGAGVLLPISVAGGLFVARHRIDSVVAASQPISNAKAPLPPAVASVPPKAQPVQQVLWQKTPAAACAPASPVQPHAVSTATSATGRTAEKAPKEPEHQHRYGDVQRGATQRIFHASGDDEVEGSFPRRSNRRCWRYPE